MTLTRNIRIGATWSLSRQEKDSWSLAETSGAGGASAANLTAWTAATDWSEQRLSVGGTYSTVEAARRGHARVAFDVTYEHQQTIAGSGWRVAHLNRDLVTVRWYRSLWGRR
jgi:hypothetical protein